MLYQGIISGGSSPVEPVDLSPVLLWTNPSPENEFATQTVSLNLTDYAGVLIECITSGIGSTTYVKKNEKRACGTIGSETGGGVARMASVSETNVVFSNAYATDTVTNTAVRPNKIYGVKEYVVEPVVGDLLWTNPNTKTAFTPQKISVDLSNAKGAVIEVMISTTSQIVCSKQLVYKGDGPVGIGYSAGGVAQTRNITSVEADGITFETGYNANTASTTILIPYKIYSIN